jgi:hypothetical protein
MPEESLDSKASTSNNPPVKSIQKSNLRMTKPKDPKDPDEELNEDQKIKKRQLKFIVDELNIIYSGHQSYQVFLKKAREELMQNKGNSGCESRSNA